MECNKNNHINLTLYGTIKIYLSNYQNIKKLLKYQLISETYTIYINLRQDIHDTLEKWGDRLSFQM